MLQVKPILSTLLRHKSSSLLTILQIAITFAVVVNSISIINQRLEQIDRDTGLKESQLMAFNITPIGGEYNIEQNFKADAELVKNIPGVIDAVFMNQIPLSGNGDSSGVAASREKFENREIFGSGVFRGDHHVVNTLGVNIIAGRNFTEEDVIYTKEKVNPNVVLITQSLADKLYPDGDALGKTVFFWGFEVRVIGIIEKMAGPWVWSQDFDENLIHPMIVISRFSRMLVRVEESQLNEVLGSVEKLLLERNPNRVITSVRSMTEMKQRSYSDDTAMTMILWGVVMLLILITALGIIGLVSFNVNQRTKQIGTRRALGARKIDILTYFVTENILITSIGVVLGSAITVGLNVYLVETFEMSPIEWLYFPVGILIMLIMGVMSVWYPATKASAISPAIATQSV